MGMGALNDESTLGLGFQLKGLKSPTCTSMAATAPLQRSPFLQCLSQFLPFSLLDSFSLVSDG
ncbi:hypothetical protein SLEP1_g5840 [Rubroshorea leprosula]|uniref:Uncharacterized protein n=1 Tax=Rubroshorea leprosula TaxID=152421 RepID=A0AAV5HT81_9ROSI|nr:hypothetical protein SLEP1_g5840 [Rubroshorea leprosula]